MPNRTVSKPKVASTPPVAPTSGSDNSNTGAKIDKSGLYDLQQVKRLLDDEVIAVSLSIHFFLTVNFTTGISLIHSRSNRAACSIWRHKVTMNLQQLPTLSL